jgi:hypothetical protein
MARTCFNVGLILRNFLALKLKALKNAFGTRTLKP